MKRKRLSLLYFFMHTLCFYNAYAGNTHEAFIEDKTCELKVFEKGNPDKNPSLILLMTVKKHQSGVAYAAEFELINNTHRNITLKIPSNTTEAFLTIIVLKEEGSQQKLQNLRKNGIGGLAQISQMPKEYVMDGLEKQPFDEFIFKAGNKKTWLLNLKDILQTNDEVKKVLSNSSEGNLMVSFRFKYFLDTDGCDKQYKRVRMGYMQDEHFSLESYLPPN